MRLPCPTNGGYLMFHFFDESAKIFDERTKIGDERNNFREILNVINCTFSNFFLTNFSCKTTQPKRQTGFIYPCKSVQSASSAFRR